MGLYSYSAGSMCYSKQKKKKRKNNSKSKSAIGPGAKGSGATARAQSTVELLQATKDDKATGKECGATSHR